MLMRQNKRRQLYVATNKPGEIVVRMPDVMATQGLGLWCVHLALNARISDLAKPSMAGLHDIF